MLDEILYLPLQSSVVAFSDDLALVTKVRHSDIKKILENDLLQISRWCLLLVRNLVDPNVACENTQNHL